MFHYSKNTKKVLFILKFSLYSTILILLELKKDQFVTPHDF